MGRVGGKEDGERVGTPKTTPGRRVSVFDSSSSDEDLPPPPAVLKKTAAPVHHVKAMPKDEDYHYEASVDEPVVQGAPAVFPPTSPPKKALPCMQGTNGVPVHNGPAPDDSPVSFPPAGHTTTVGGSSVGPAPTFVGNRWTTGMFDCHEHSTNALMTAFFPCVTFGQIVEILEGGNISCALGSLMYLLLAPALCSQWIMGSLYRTRLRRRYNLVQAPTEDWIAHLCCPSCALCQEFRELKNRGIDPSLGWLGNLAQLQETRRQAKTSPPKNQAMKR